MDTLYPQNADLPKIVDTGLMGLKWVSTRFDKIRQNSTKARVYELALYGKKWIQCIHKKAQMPISWIFSRFYLNMKALAARRAWPGPTFNTIMKALAARRAWPGPTFNTNMKALAARRAWPGPTIIYESRKAPGGGSLFHMVGNVIARLWVLGKHWRRLESAVALWIMVSKLA